MYVSSVSEFCDSKIHRQRSTIHWSCSTHVKNSFWKKNAMMKSLISWYHCFCSSRNKSVILNDLLWCLRRDFIRSPSFGRWRDLLLFNDSELGSLSLLSISQYRRDWISYQKEAWNVFVVHCLRRKTTLRCNILNRTSRCEWSSLQSVVFTELCKYGHRRR